LNFVSYVVRQILDSIDGPNIITEFRYRIHQSFGLHVWTLRCLVHQSLVSISGHCFNRFYLGTTTAFGQPHGPENIFHLLPHLIEL